MIVFLALTMAVDVSPTPGFTNPIHLSEPLFDFFHWINQIPMLTTLLVLMGLDILTGLFLGIYQKQLSSVISWRGMSRKVIMLLIVATAALVEQFTGGIPVSKLASVCYIFTEAISILENAACAGVPLPAALVTALAKMRESQKTVSLPIATIKQDIQVTAEIPKVEVTTSESEKP